MPSYITTNGVRTEVKSAAQENQVSYFSGELTYEQQSISTTQESLFTVPVQGVLQGDNLVVTFDGPIAGSGDEGLVTYEAYVSTPNEVTLILGNPQANTATINANTVRILAIRVGG